MRAAMTSPHRAPPPRVGSPLVRLAALVAPLALVAACEKQPSQIRVKLPRESLQSTVMNPVLPPFEKKNDTIQLRASSFDEKGAYMGPAKVKWSVSDPSVASVNYDGVVTTLASGETKVIATSEGYEKQLTAELPIKVVIVAKVELSLDGKPEVHLGETLQLVAKVLDDRGNVIPDAKVTWRTSDHAASVSITGEVEGRAIGDTDVIAEVGAQRARMNVKVLDWRPGAR
jgi:hypothetical protein